MSKRIPKEIQAELDAIPDDHAKTEGVSHLSLNESKGTGTVDVRVRARQVTIETLQDSLKQHGVDLNIWMVDRWLTNDWSVTMGNKGTGGNGAQTYMNVQVKVWLKRREAEPQEHILDRFIADAKKHSPKYKAVKRSKKKATGYMCEINPADIHLGLRSWGKETLRPDYDTEIACKMVEEGVSELARLSEPFNPEYFLLVIGNDFYNADNIAGTTTAGTQQDVDGRWLKTFSRGRVLAVKCADILREIAPVQILIMPGNHDEQSAHALGEILEAWYRNAKDVTIQRSPAKRQYHQHGRCLIGFCHGAKLKAKDLPMLMAQDNRAEVWGNTVYAEWHLAHLHQTALVDIGGVRVRRIASPSPVSAWAAGMGYDSVLEMQAFMWHKERGNVARLSYLPSEEIL